jgi:membrane-associated phospholipid phosphatase
MRAHQRAGPPRAVRGPIARLRRLDRGIMRRTRRIDSPGLDRALVSITTAANYWRLWLAIAGLLALLGGRRGRAAAGRGLVALVIAGLATNGPAKLLARRRRPASPGRPALIRMPRSTSFPSGHSAAAFAFATGAVMEMPALAPVLGPLAAAVGYSRVHTGVHYPSDVAGGAAIGIGSAVLASRLGRHARPSAAGVEPGPHGEAAW